MNTSVCVCDQSIENIQEGAEESWWKTKQTEIKTIIPNQSKVNQYKQIIWK